MMRELVTIETFKQQVYDVEGIKIEIRPRNGEIRRMVRAYTYTRLPDDATVDELRNRINECLKPFIYFVNLSDN